MTRAHLALGSNVGDREAYLASARRLLAEHGVRLVRESSVRETEPFGVTDQPAFLNQVLEVEWLGTPRSLLDTVKTVEKEAGRTATYRWGPREIDVDILLFGTERVDEPGLTIPHPGLAERQFVKDLLGELLPEGPPGAPHEPEANRMKR
jgi:2-amino-4-hydroxy-6-hydroxymethyldihydropteridine diphosphokinase